MDSLNFDFKLFVKEKDSQADVPDKSKSQPCSNLNGDEARQFYEDVLKSSTATVVIPQAPQRTRQNFKKSAPLKRLTGNIFTMAQNNDVRGTKALIESGVDVNSQDEFGWTALMCAVCSNSEAVVKYLLETGADITICDKGGYNAVALARNKQHNDILKLLLYRTSLLHTKKRKIEPKEMYCKLCDEKYHGDPKKHECSTVHLLKSNTKTKTFYGIPESNRGFQLLMQQGWDRERGLGPEGSGRKFPIKVKQKPDRAGVGAEERKKERTTNSYLTSRPMRSRDSRSFERQFRMEFA